MPKRQQKATGITNAPLDREEAEQAQVPPQGKSVIGKAGNAKARSPKARRTTGVLRKKAA
jgi:hypothetical protein